MPLSHCDTWIVDRQWAYSVQRVPDCLGGLSQVGISSRSTRPWNGQPPSNILKVYRFLTSGKGSFSIWRPRWLLGSYNDYISKTIQRRKLVLVSKRGFWAQGIQYNQCKYRRLITYWQIQDGSNTNGHHTFQNPISQLLFKLERWFWCLTVG